MDRMRASRFAACFSAAVCSFSCLGEGAAKEEEPSAPLYEYWAEQTARPFVAGQAGVGAFNQVTAQVGYGRPFWIWGGLQTQIASTTEFGSILVGPRFDAILLNLMVDVRRTWAYSRRRSETASAYDAFGEGDDPRNHYTSLDAWIWGYVPLGRLLGYWEFSSVYAFSDPSPYAIFEEYYRLTLEGQLGMMARTVLQMKFYDERILVGPAADVALSPSRSPLVRVGASFSWQFTSHLSLQMLLTLPVASPDNFDAFTQSWGLARVSYSFATGEPRPGL